MRFPYSSMRASQQEMMDDVRKSIESKMHLVADAPTGLGKTIAALFPAVGFAAANGKAVFFLTSRLSQHKMAVETLKLMRGAGNAFSAVDIVGKKHLCSFETRDMDSSMFANFCSAMIKDKRCDYYKKVWRNDMAEERGRLLQIVSSRGPVSTQEAKEIFSGNFCTYEMLMEAAKRSDVIVGDYFHIFGMGDKFLKRMNKSLENTIIIVDEAHNLAARLRSYMSSRLTTRTCELAAREARDFAESEAEDFARGIADVLREMGGKYLFEENEVFVLKDEFMDRINQMGSYDSIVAKLTAVGEHMLEEKKISYVDRVAAFLHMWGGGDYGYARILSRARLHGKDHIGLQHDCLDPSLISRPVISGSHSTILMSGTLSPMEMHRDLLGMEPGRAMLKSYPSPFPRHNRKNIIAQGITTKYRERTLENYAQIARTVALSAHAIKGNAAVFFPSYEIRDTIHELVAPQIKKHILLEDSTMTKEERDHIKEEMEEHAAQGCVLFGVLAGSFSEGIDLPGELLNGVIIVGLPLERPTLSVKALIDYYDQRFNRGVAYGYTYPAMIKVMQAAGRCIRSEHDRGVIVFADERFLWRSYRYIFPRSWDFVVTERPEIEIRKFFGDKSVQKRLIDA